MFPHYSERNMNVLMTFLKEKGVDIVDFRVKNLFSSYCRYGYVLECVFQLHREKWRKKKIMVPFNSYIKKNLNYSSRHALRLRMIGRIWFQYKGLERLAISINEFYQRLEEIELMMKNNATIAQYWRN